MTAAAIGAGLAMVVVAWLSLRYARQVARFLAAFDAGRQAFRIVWRRGPRSAPAAGPVLQTAVQMLDTVQRDTVAALAGMGMNRKAATARVRQEGTAADVETLLRRCMVKTA